MLKQRNLLLFTHESYIMQSSYEPLRTNVSGLVTYTMYTIFTNFLGPQNSWHFNVSGPALWTTQML